MEKTKIYIEKRAADEIAAARRYRGYTQAVLADMMKAAQNDISTLESGKRNLQLSTLQRVADALEMDVEIRLVPREGLAGKDGLSEKEREGGCDEIV